NRAFPSLAAKCPAARAFLQARTRDELRRRCAPLKLLSHLLAEGRQPTLEGSLPSHVPWFEQLSDAPRPQRPAAPDVHLPCPHPRRWLRPTRCAADLARDRTRQQSDARRLGRRHP